MAASASPISEVRAPLPAWHLTNLTDWGKKIAGVQAVNLAVG